MRWGTFVPPETHSKYPTHATTTGEVTGVRSVFRTTYAYFAGAVVLELMCICLIAPTYWGWWKLGRSVSFSPLEIAKVGLFARIEPPLPIGIVLTWLPRDSRRRFWPTRTRMPQPETWLIHI